MSKTFIGIDFGTTKTLVSVYNEQTQNAKIIRMGRGRYDIPTSVYAVEDGSFLCGDEAEDQRATDPMRHARAFKMKLGSQSSALSYFEGTGFRQWTAAQLTRHFLSYVRIECEQYIGKPINRAVITRPVRFSPRQCEQLEQAARAAGFEELTFITEPEAAAYTYCRHQTDDLFRNALIVDWGGGTLDMALVSRRGERIITYPQYTTGILKGGENFDDALYHLVHSRYADEQDLGSRLGEDMLNPVFNYAIRKNLRATKEILSRLEQKRVILSGSGGAYPRLTVQRAEFEKSILGDIEEAAQLAGELIKDIQDPSLKPDKLILVGGSSRIPIVARLLQERTGLPCCTWDMSVEAVGLGAALVAAEHRRDADSALPPHKQAPVVETPLPTQASASSLPLYKQGLAYMHGVGVNRDFVRAADYFKQGHETGDLNASYMLCSCYTDGIGIARNYDKAYRLAEELAVNKKYYPAYYFLAAAHRTGRGAPVDIEKAQVYSDELDTRCAAPLDGVDEILRYDALLSNECEKPDPDWHKVVQLARENMSLSNIPQRYGMLGVALMRLVGQQNEPSPSLIQELRSVLDAGIKSGDSLSCFCKSFILNIEDNVIYPHDPQKAYSLLKKSAETMGQVPLFALSRSDLTPESEREQYRQKFWHYCQYGASGIVPDDALPCQITLQEHPYAMQWKVFSQYKAQHLLQNAFQSVTTLASPFICLTNTGDKTLKNIKLRVCGTDGEAIDQLIDISTPIEPSQTLRLDMLHFGINLGNSNDLHVEVTCNNQKTCLSLDMSDFRLPEPPIVLCWERSLFGGAVLKVEAVGDGIPPLSVRCKKLNSAACSSTKTLTRIPVSFGWREFSDHVGLGAEQFELEVQGYGSLLGQIVGDANVPFLANPPEII